jgi:hypothetical protein
MQQLLQGQILLSNCHQSLVLKMLKSLTNVKIQFELDDEKHLSNSGAYQVKQEDFRFNILYRSFSFKLYNRS